MQGGRKEVCEIQKENDKIHVEVNVKSCDILRINDQLKCIESQMIQSGGRVTQFSKEIVDLNREY